MTELLEKLVTEVKKLPNAEQDVWVKRFLEELEDERLWAEKFAKSEGLFTKMAVRVRQQIAAGQTAPLNVLVDKRA